MASRGEAREHEARRNPLHISRFSNQSFDRLKKRPPKAVFFGATGRTRTGDLLITNQLLYQLSHSSTRMCGYYITAFFRSCQDKNRALCENLIKSAPADRAEGRQILHEPAQRAPAGEYAKRAGSRINSLSFDPGSVWKEPPADRQARPGAGVRVRRRARRGRPRSRRGSAWTALRPCAARRAPQARCRSARPRAATCPRRARSAGRR